MTVEGTSLYRFCIANGLKQHVKHLTREHYLLDLVISDLSPRCIEILHAISDHNMVLACFDIGIPEAIVVTRTVFDYGKTDWTNMKSDIVSFDWTFIGQANVDDAERYFHNTLFTILRRHTPERLLLERKSKRPVSASYSYQKLGRGHT